MNPEKFKDVKISITPSFKYAYLEAGKTYFVHKYTITINNYSEVPIRVDSRFWQIHDLLHGYKVVQGEGIIGEQPVILPTQSHTYSSSCILLSEIGSMQGFYTITNMVDQKPYIVVIPNFNLIATYVMN